MNVHRMHVAMTTAVVVVASVTSSVTHAVPAPDIRRSINERNRHLEWDDHCEDLDERGPDCFRRQYRMPQQTFEIFPDILRPLLDVNHYLAGRSTNGVFGFVVACVDGLFIKIQAQSPVDTANVLSYYSGQKSAYGINVQAMCTTDYRLCSMSAISPGVTNDWVAWNRSAPCKAVSRLPKGFHTLVDAAYLISDQLLTPYPAKTLPPGEDTSNFHLSQLRVKIEQSFGILVSQWGILWRPLREQFVGRTDLIAALFHLHKFLRDEKVKPIYMSEEDEESGKGHPALTQERTSRHYGRR